MAIPSWIPLHLLNLSTRAAPFHSHRFFGVYSELNLLLSFDYISQTFVYSSLICNLTGFQLYSGSEGGAAQPAIRQSRAGYDQTM